MCVYVYYVCVHMSVCVCVCAHEHVCVYMCVCCVRGQHVIYSVISFHVSSRVYLTKKKENGGKGNISSILKFRTRDAGPRTYNLTSVPLIQAVAKNACLPAQFSGRTWGTKFTSPSCMPGTEHSTVTQKSVTMLNLPKKYLLGTYDSLYCVYCTD